MTEPEGDLEADRDTRRSQERAAKRVELGLELIEHIEAETMPLSEIMKRIESVTTVPTTQRNILKAAEDRDLIVRDRHPATEGNVSGPGVYLAGSKSVGEKDIKQRDGDFTCERCGASLSTGHFVAFEDHEHGPFGPECVQYVLGRK